MRARGARPTDKTILFNISEYGFTFDCLGKAEPAAALPFLLAKTFVEWISDGTENSCR